MNKPKIGIGFVIIGNETATEISRLVRLASQQIPAGRTLFVIWKAPDGWTKNRPIETIALTAVLGRPEDRDETGWLFLGNGTVRLYQKNATKPEETLMWVGMRRTGEKAYRRIRDEAITADVKTNSTIPVAHPVFTRDIANNVWHLPANRGIIRVIERLQALHSWSDETALIFKGNKMRHKKHVPITGKNDLIPVAEKTAYQLDGFPFPAK